MFYRLVLIFFFINTTLLAQGGWKKKYHLQNSLNSICTNVFEAQNGNLIMLGFTYSSQNASGSNKLSVVGIDYLGNMLWRKDYGTKKLEYLHNIFAPNGAVLKDGSFFYHTLCARDSNNAQIGVLIKFNYNGDTLWQKFFREMSPKDLIPQAITKSVDGGLLITGASQEPNGQACFVIKTDLNGNELWRKRINKSTPNVQDGTSIVQDSTTKKIVIVGYQYIGSSTYQETYSNVLILDSLGTKTLQTTFNNGDGGGAASVIRLRDGNFLTSCNLNANNDIGALTRYVGRALKFNIQGNVLWSKTYDTLSAFGGIGFFSELKNGDIMMVGALDTLINYGLSGPVKIRLYKTDKDGNLKWKKYIGSAYTYTSSEYVRCINPTQDGGFVLTAWMLNAPSTFSPPYNIIKIDSTGCDTSEAWCQSVALGINDFNRKTGWEFELFPNPAKEFVNIKIDAPEEKNFQIQINDVTGKEVKTVTLNAGTNLQINTSEYNGGVYFISVYYEGRSIENKRLLIVR